MMWHLAGISVAHDIYDVEVRILWPVTIMTWQLADISVALFCSCLGLMLAFCGGGQSQYLR